MAMPPTPDHAIHQRVFIIGGDSRIGAALGAALRQRGAQVTLTTRRADRRAAALFLDLQDLLSIDALDLRAYDLAYLCAGISTYAACEGSEVARCVNVDHTLRLCQRLRDAGCASVFLSTSAVFDGRQAVISEDDPVSPTTAYGRQKAEVERLLLADNVHAGPRASVVRLSKVLMPDAPIVVDWRAQLHAARDIQPLSDLWLSPISPRYTVEGLIALGRSEQGGVFHLSGERDVSYADCAYALAARWGQPMLRVRPRSALEANVDLPYRPAHPTLGMARTTQLTGLLPQSFDACMDEVAQ